MNGLGWGLGCGLQSKHWPYGTPWDSVLLKPGHQLSGGFLFRAPGQWHSLGHEA